MTQVSDLKKVTTVLDARGPRFGAAITTVVFAAALATHNAWFIVAQAIVFAIGAFKGPQFTPYAYIYKFAVKPFLKGEVPTEDVRPPQFAFFVVLHAPRHAQQTVLILAAVLSADPFHVIHACLP